MYKVLGIVPARKGSKGIKRKNLVDINGKPLIEYTFEGIAKSKIINDFIISTDSKTIYDISKKYDPIFNGLRPANLSEDNSLTIDVVKYELNQLGNTLEKYSHIMLLQPTCPLRTYKHIDESIEKLLKSNGRSLISVVQLTSYHPLRMKKIFNGKLFNYVDTGFEDMRPRQKLPKVYIRNGSIYLANVQDVLSLSTFSAPDCIPYEMGEDESVNIDSEADLLIADYYIKKKSIERNL